MKTLLSLAFTAALLAVTIWILPACGAAPSNIEFSKATGTCEVATVLTLDNGDKHAFAFGAGTYYKAGSSLPGGVTDEGTWCYVIERAEYQGIPIGAGAVGGNPVCDEAFGPFRLGAQSPLQPVGFLRVE